MLKPEKHYDFRARLDRVHRSDRRNPSATIAPGEIALADALQICYPAGCSEAIRETALDLVDYLTTSMAIGAGCRAIRPGETLPAGSVLLALDETIAAPKAFRFDADSEGIRITGSDDAGVRRGGIYLEDLLTMREAPYYKAEAALHEPLYSPRIVHSAWGEELYPDGQLNAILHAGFDSIIIFYEGIDRTHIGRLDFADVIRRAARYGLEVFFYSYLPFERGPHHADATAYYDAQYGEMFRRYPGLAGVMIASEDMNFPSLDQRSCGGPRAKAGAFETRPGSGFFPCSDAPDLLRIIRDVIFRVNPKAKMIFNTYAWGCHPLDVRSDFIRKLPEGIILQVTYDIFKYRRVLGEPMRVADYSIAADEPGYYFTSECEAAARYGKPLLCTSNTAGRTWDLGDVPYIPVPQRWMTRMGFLDKYRRECGLSGLYECHHYGWWPSVITDLTRAFYNSPQCNLEEELRRQAKRLAGDGAPELLAAWKLWSDAFDYFPTNSDDQYGPLRVGPSFPMTFDTAGKSAPPFPCDPGAHFGNQIIITNYNIGFDATPPGRRYPVEVEALDRFDALWTKGLAHHAKALAQAHPFRTEELEREENLARFIQHCARTCRNMKRYRLACYRLNTLRKREDIAGCLDDILQFFRDEEVNAREAIPLVEADSSLGWECSMEYVCDREHLEWKLKVLEGAMRSLIKSRELFLRVNEPGCDLEHVTNN